MKGDAGDDANDDKSPPPDEACSVEVDAELARRAAAAPSRGDGNGEDDDDDDDDDGETAPSAAAVAMGMGMMMAAPTATRAANERESAQADGDAEDEAGKTPLPPSTNAAGSIYPALNSSSSSRPATDRTLSTTGGGNAATRSASCTRRPSNTPAGSRFPPGAGPGAYHVVPRTRASLAGAPTTGGAMDNSSSSIGSGGGGNAVHVDTESVRTDEAEVLAVTTTTIPSSTVDAQPANTSSSEPSASIPASADRDIVLPVPNGFVQQQGQRQRTASQQQRPSETNAATGSGRNNNNNSRRSSFSSSVPGAHPIAGIGSDSTGNSRDTGGDGGMGSRRSSLVSTNNTTTETRSSSGLGRASSSSAGVGGVVESAGSEAQVDAAADPEVTATAYLVEDRQELEDLPSAEIVDLDEIRPPSRPFHRRREGRITLLVIGLLLLALGIILGVLLTNGSSSSSRGSLGDDVSTEMPTQAPTFDPRPTLEAVQSRGYVRCGIEEAAGGAVRFGQYNTDLCRALAASVLGDPSRIRFMPVGDDDRYRRLLDRELDVLFAGDTFTLEKLVREPSTGSGLAFGYPYYQAAVVYAGLPAYVQCASNQKRHNECDDLSICAVETPEIRSLITSHFPTSFVTFGLFPAMEASLRSGACNVIVSDTYRLSGSSLQEDIDSGRYIISDYHISRNLISSVVRLGDPVWYDVVEGTRLTGFRASQIGLYRDLDRCPANSTSSGTDAGVSGVSFYNAAMCVGNAVEVFQRSLGQTVLSYGTYLPIIDAPNFGSLECNDCANVLESKGGLQEINDRGHLNCAVYLNPMYNLTLSSLATLVNVKFCELLAVAIFQGKADAVNVTYIDEMDYSEFPQEFDVVAGAGFESKVGWDVTNAGSMSFSWPYFVHDKYQYGGSVYDGVGLFISFAIDNENMSLIFVATAVIIATMYAQRQGITRESSFDMPLIHTFGDGLTFMLRDVVSFGGNYDDILTEALSSSDGTAVRGWNVVIPNYYLAAKTPVSYCDYTGNCPPCEWLLFDGTYICISVGPY